MATPQQPQEDFGISVSVADTDLIFGLVGVGKNTENIPVSVLRTQLNTGSQTFADGISVGTSLFVSGAISLDGAVTINNSQADKDFRIGAVGQVNALFVKGSDGHIGLGTDTATNLLTLGDTNSVISTDTTDGSDSKRIKIAGGGDTDITRGAYINIMGNEYPGQEGDLALLAGHSGLAGRGRIRFFTALGVERMTIDKDGNTTISDLAGVGTRNVVVDANGVLSAP